MRAEDCQHCMRAKDCQYFFARQLSAVKVLVAGRKAQLPRRSTRGFSALGDEHAYGPRNELSHQALKPERDHSGNRLVIVNDVYSQCQTNQPSRGIHVYVPATKSVKRSSRGTPTNTIRVAQKILLVLRCVDLFE
jgi:hypothetical protein